MGLLLLIKPVGTIVFLVQFLGIYWFIEGIISIVRIFIDKTAWGWKLFAGIIGILAGLAIIQYPLWSALLVPTTLVWLFGFFGILIGITALIQAFQGAGWGEGILGVLSILLGTLLLFNPMIGVATLPFFLGILGLVGGVAAVIMAFRLK
jgi:uncharacterized membrane protein HdeD (DUF308 family)